MNDNWVLEWSKKQNAFHIQEAGIMVERNLNHLLSNNSTDYIVLCIAPRAECDRVADRFRKYLKNEK